MKNYKRKAFSLVEVLIFVVVFSLFFIVAATVVVSSLRITTANKNKIKATHYNEELGEWLRSEKEINWGGTVYIGSGPVNSFTERATIQYTVANPKTEFCFNTSPIVEWPNSGLSDCIFALDNQFKRTATFSVTPISNYVNQVAIVISTEWKDGNIVHSSSIQKVFSIWE